MLITMLTTVDNPYSPIENWDAWLNYDMACGYNTSGLLARIVNTSHDLSEKDFDQAILAAIDEIVSENVSGLHMKVVKEVPDDQPLGQT